MKIEIELTEAEDKALRITNTDPIQLVKNAAQMCINQIVRNELQRMLLDPNIKVIPADEEKIVMDFEFPEELSALLDKND
jgi:hypothetical protein